MKTQEQLIADLAKLDRMKQQSSTLRWDLIRHWEARYRELEHENQTRWSHGLHSDTARVALMNAIFNRIVSLRYPNKKGKGTRYERGGCCIVRVVIGEDNDGTY